jgi:hypothetical protein
LGLIGPSCDEIARVFVNFKHFPDTSQDVAEKAAMDELLPAVVWQF